MRAGLECRQLRAHRFQPNRALAVTLIDDVGNAHFMQAHAGVLGRQRRKKSL